MSAFHSLIRRLLRAKARWGRQGLLSGASFWGFLVVLSCSACEPPPPPDIFVGQGEVEQVVSHDRRVVIAHDAIPDFFPAKTSSFALRSPALLDQLQPGTYVRFTLERTDQTLYLARVEEIEGPTATPRSTPAAASGE